jgi:dipeptidyl aminopeptidase/acylaminoacyl peptidase
MGFAFAAFCCATLTRGAADSAREIEAIYHAFRVAHASLAPDGQRVAFLVRSRLRFELELFDVADLLKKKEVSLPAAMSARPVFFAWASPKLLVVAFDGPLVVSVNADTGATTTLVDGRTFPDSRGLRHQLRPLMFADGSRGQLLLELTTTDRDHGRVGLDLVRLDLRTGAREITEVQKLELPGGELLVDRQGQPRIVWQQAGAAQPFLLRSSLKGRTSWQPLDRSCTEPAPLQFFVTPKNLLGERSVPLGFDADPEVLYFASNVGRNTQGVFALNLRSGRRTDFVVEDADFDLVDARLPWGGTPLVFDRTRGNLIGVRCNGASVKVRWLDEEIGAVEKTLGGKFPSREIQALDWDDQRNRFLIWVGSNGDPGRYFVYDRATERCTEYLKRQADVKTENLNHSEAFTCSEGRGSPNIRGYLTLPHTALVAKPPLVVWLHDGPGLRTAPGFSRDAQALASTGLVVAQVDYAGSGGYGLAWQHAMHGRADEAPLANVAAVIRWLDSRGLIDARRIAVIGEGVGGYLALRALENEPDLLRCAVAINAPMNLQDLGRDLEFSLRKRDADTQLILNHAEHRPRTIDEMIAQQEGGGSNAVLARSPGFWGARPDFQRDSYSAYLKGFKNLGDASVLADARRITKPILLLHDPAHRYAPIGPVRALYAGLQRRKQSAALAEIPPQFAAGSLRAREQVIQRIAEFLNVTLYDFDVELGETKEVK